MRSHVYDEEMVPRDAENKESNEGVAGVVLRRPEGERPSFAQTTKLCFLHVLILRSHSRSQRMFASLRLPTSPLCTFICLLPPYYAIFIYFFNFYHCILELQSIIKKLRSHENSRQSAHCHRLVKIYPANFHGEILEHLRICGCDIDNSETRKIASRCLPPFEEHFIP